jgi:hypothetical protein
MNGIFRRDDKIGYFELTKLKLFGDEIRGMRKEVVRQITRMKVRGGWEKMKGIKRAVLPYGTTLLFLPPTIINLQTIAWFSYLILFINLGQFAHEYFLSA